jgi:hypothetical protein
MPITNKYLQQLPPKSKIEVARRVLSNMTAFSVGSLASVNQAVERMEPPPRKMNPIERTEYAIEILQAAVQEMREFTEAEVI